MNKQSPIETQLENGEFIPTLICQNSCELNGRQASAPLVLAKTFQQGTAGTSAGQDLPAGNSKQGKVLAKTFQEGTASREKC